MYVLYRNKIESNYDRKEVLPIMETSICNVRKLVLNDSFCNSLDSKLAFFLFVKVYSTILMSVLIIIFQKSAHSSTFCELEFRWPQPKRHH
jgi:hypothetical protein